MCKFSSCKSLNSVISINEFETKGRQQKRDSRSRFLNGTDVDIGQGGLVIHFGSPLVTFRGCLAANLIYTWNSPNHLLDINHFLQTQMSVCWDDTNIQLKITVSHRGRILNYSDTKRLPLKP